MNLAAEAKRLRAKEYAKMAHRDPKYVRDQLKSAKERKAANPPEEKPVTEAVSEDVSQAIAETTKEPTIFDSLSSEIQSDIEELLGEQNVEVTETAIAPEASASPTEAPKGTAEKTPKTAKEPKTPKEPKVPSRLLDSHCRVCGKALINAKSVTRGIGPVCFAAMTRTFKWTEAEAKERVEKATDEEWAHLIDEIRALLDADATVTDVPEGYVEMSKWWTEGQKHNLTSSALSRAVGGDRAFNEPLDERFVAVYVQQGNRARKYLPPASMTEEAFAAISASAKPRILTGAAKSAKVKADAKKAAATAETTMATKLPDGTYS